jgi:hypothetical protein
MPQLVKGQALQPGGGRRSVKDVPAKVQVPQDRATAGGEHHVAGCFPSHDEREVIDQEPRNRDRPVDWSGLALGDPAVDCMVAWTLLDPQTRPTFRARVDVDDGTWGRGRAWALSIALVALPYYLNTNEQIATWARYAIDQAVEDICGH